MASTRLDTLAGTYGDAPHRALTDGRDDMPDTAWTDGFDEAVVEADPGGDPLDALLREELLIADDLADADALAESVPDAALFLPFRDGRPSWR